jgi:hypothetical protein
MKGVRYADLTTITRKESWTKHDFDKEMSEGSFVAKSYNLGTVAIPFDTRGSNVGDRIIFRLKEVGQKNWYYQNTYNARQFQNNALFPFGFPVIEFSKNKSYVFQIEFSDRKNYKDISISNANNYFLSKYKFARKELTGSPIKLVNFLVDKSSAKLSLLTSNEIKFISFLALLPFVFYFLFVFCVKKFSVFLKRGSIFILGKNIDLMPLRKIISNLTHGLSRDNKIRLCCLIVCVGFFSSVSNHYFQGVYLNKTYPFNSFLPNAFFGDFYSAFDQWTAYKFVGTGFGLSYFPGTYLIIDILVKLFSRTTVIIVYLSFFTIFLLTYSYSNLKTNSRIESLLNTFVISILSYPFLITFQTANVEIITFISVVLFFVFYSKKRFLSIFFLAYAISMKVFPGIFIVLLFSEKRYKEIFLIMAFVVLFTLLPLVLFDGGFNRGIGNYVANLTASQKMYFDLMIINDAGNHYGHSLLNGLRIILPGMFSSMRAIVIPYEIFASIAFVLIAAYVIFLEKVFWKKIACLVMAMNLLPFTSTDYKLLYIFLPLFYFINYPRNKYDLIFIVLFSLILIPKDYLYFNNNPLSNLNVVANPIIMLLILLIIILSRIKFVDNFCKYVIRINR